MASELINLEALIRKDTANLTTRIEIGNGASIEIRYLSREDLVRISRSALIWKASSGGKGGREQVVDPDLFTKAFIEKVVCGWTGMTLRCLLDYIPLDLSSVPVDQLDAPLPYSPEQMALIIRNSYNIDNLLQDSACNIRLFQDVEAEEAARKNLPSSPNTSSTPSA